MQQPVIVSFHRIDNRTLRATFTNPDGTAYDLTGATLRMVCKALATDTDAAAKFQKNISASPNADGTIVAPATLGIADFYILPADTTTLGLVTDEPSVSYILAVKIKKSGAWYTPIDGKLWLKQQVVENF